MEEQSTGGGGVGGVEGGEAVFGRCYRRDKLKRKKGQKGLVCFILNKHLYIQACLSVQTGTDVHTVTVVR